MEIKVLKNREDIFILELHGSLDLYSSTQLKDLVMKLIEGKTEGIIIDLKEVDKVKSAGMGALISISSTLKKINCALAIANTCDTVKKAMEAARLSVYLPIVPTLREAVEYISKNK